MCNSQRCYIIFRIFSIKHVFMGSLITHFSLFIFMGDVNMLLLYTVGFFIDFRLFVMSLKTKLWRLRQLHLPDIYYLPNALNIRDGSSFSNILSNRHFSLLLVLSPYGLLNSSFIASDTTLIFCVHLHLLLFYITNINVVLLVTPWTQAITIC